MGRGPRKASHRVSAAGFGDHWALWGREHGGARRQAHSQGLGRSAPAMSEMPFFEMEGASAVQLGWYAGRLVVLWSTVWARGGVVLVLFRCCTRRRPRRRPPGLMGRPPHGSIMRNLTRRQLRRLRRHRGELRCEWCNRYSAVPGMGPASTSWRDWVRFARADPIFACSRERCRSRRPDGH